METKEELLDPGKLVEHIIHSSIDMIAVLDTELNYQVVNKKAKDLYGGNDIIGKNILDLFPQIIHTGMYEDLQKALRGQVVRNSDYRSFLGRRYDNFYLPLKNDNGKIVGVMVIGHDNTEMIEATITLKSKVDELKKSEERYQLMTKEVEDYAILMLNPEGNVENWNMGAEKIKGYKAEEIIGKNFSTFYTKDDRESGLPEKLLAQARETGKASVEGWRIRKDGTMFWGSVVITALHNAKGEIAGFTKVTRDLTERKLMEDQLRNYAEQLKQKNKDLEHTNAELSSFAYIASHDLQEPLRKIRAFGRIVMDNEAGNLTTEGKDYFMRMVNAADRMQNLIEALLEFSRITSRDKGFELTDLNILLTDVKKELQEVMESKKAIIHAQHLPSLFVIPYQFRQVLSNIINNSLKYAQKGTDPVITITAETVKPKEMRERKLLEGNEFIRLTIKDNGIGFEQEKAGKIFELFQRLHGKSEYEGSGIGLAICKKIVINHYGLITAESEPGKGAAFYIFMPKNAVTSNPLAN